MIHVLSFETFDPEWEERLEQVLEYTPKISDWTPAQDRTWLVETDLAPAAIAGLVSRGVPEAGRVCAVVPWEQCRDHLDSSQLDWIRDKMAAHPLSHSGYAFSPVIPVKHELN
jgi:hypothetical protein